MARFFIEWTDKAQGWTYSENVGANDLLDRMMDESLVLTFVGKVDPVTEEVGEDLPDLHCIEL